MAARSASSPIRQPGSRARSLATQGLVSDPRGDGDVNINTVTKLKNFDCVEGPQLVRFAR